MVDFYIHIGLGKTGTSAIQRMLAGNADLLKKKKKYLYVGLFFEHFDRAKMSLDVLREKLFETSQSEAATFAAELLGRCVRHCETSGLRSIIWSWEALSSRDMGTSKVLREATLGHPVKIIIYLRRQDRWIESAYYQWEVKHNPTRRPGYFATAFMI